MSDQQPSVSSIRVEKPGKAKFAPVIAGDRKKAAAATSAAAVAAPVPSVKLENVERLLGSSVKADVEPTSPDLQLEDTGAVPKVAPKVATTIQTVHTRREKAAAAVPPVARAAAPGLRRVTVAAELTAAVESKNLKLSYYLKDRKEGVPMANSTAPAVTATSGAASGRGTPRPSNVPSRSVSTVIAPQVRMVGGEIVVDEETTVVKSDEQANDQLHMDIVHDTGRNLTSHAFVKHSGSNRWNAEETKQFYEAVSMCGTDFSLMSMLFPRKTREQCKGKYRIEERSNSKKLELFLRRRVKFDTAWMDRVQKQAHSQEDESDAVAAHETKRGRPKQEFEGSPVPIPSIMSTPARRASLSSSSASSPRRRKVKSIAIEDDEGEPPAPSSSPAKSSPLKTASRSPQKRPAPRGKEATSSVRKSPRKK